jgi:hypothetical protein
MKVRSDATFRLEFDSDSPSKFGCKIGHPAAICKQTVAAQPRQVCRINRKRLMRSTSLC